MTITCTLHTRNFEWAESKNAANVAKHGISFEDAIQVFDDQYKELKDRRWEYGEDRFKVIGKMGEKEVVVIYTLRDDVIRIISARSAGRDTPSE